VKDNFNLALHSGWGNNDYEKKISTIMEEMNVKESLEIEYSWSEPKSPLTKLSPLINHTTKLYETNTNIQKVKSTITITNDNQKSTTTNNYNHKTTTTNQTTTQDQKTVQKRKPSPNKKETTKPTIEKERIPETSKNRTEEELEEIPTISQSSLFESLFKEDSFLRDLNEDSLNVNKRKLESIGSSNSTSGDGFFSPIKRIKY
jgi:hypothetical protein